MLAAAAAAHMALPPATARRALPLAAASAKHAPSSCRLHCAELCYSSSTVPSRFESNFQMA